MDIRIRRDGVKELKIDNEVHEIPHDHELCPSAAFPEAWRENFFVDPTYMSVSRSDMNASSARVAIAAMRDLTAIAERLPGISECLQGAVQVLRAGVPKWVTSEAIRSIEDEMEADLKPKVVPTEGIAFQDEVWYRDTDVEFEQELQRLRPDVCDDDDYLDY